MALRMLGVTVVEWEAWVSYIELIPGDHGKRGWSQKVETYSWKHRLLNRSFQFQRTIMYNLYVYLDVTCCNNENTDLVLK